MSGRAFFVTLGALVLLILGARLTGDLIQPRVKERPKVQGTTESPKPNPVPDVKKPEPKPEPVPTTPLTEPKLAVGTSDAAKELDRILGSGVWTKVMRTDLAPGVSKDGPHRLFRGPSGQRTIEGREGPLGFHIFLSGEGESLEGYGTLKKDMKGTTREEWIFEVREGKATGLREHVVKGPDGKVRMVMPDDPRYDEVRSGGF